MLRKTMVVLAALLAVGLGQMMPAGRPATAGQPILVQPGTQTPAGLQQLKQTDPAAYRSAMQAVQPSEPRARQDAAGGPDADGYLWKDSDESGGPVYSWDNNYSYYSQYDDDTYYTFNFGWNFMYRGVNYNTVYVGSNGYCCFTGPSSWYPSYPFPNSGTPNDVFAPFTQDMDSYGGGYLKWGSYGSAPNRKVVCTWESYSRFYMNGYYTFQVIFSESDGTITFQYQTDNGYGWAYGGVGIENSTGTVGLNIDNTRLKNNYAIKFQQLSGTRGLWTGAVSGDWNNSANWDFPLAPDAGMDVHIPAGCNNYPTTTSGQAYNCKSLLIDGGGSVSVDVGKTMNCATDITNGGTLTNGGVINCGRNFQNNGDFTSGPYSQFYFNGSAEATIGTGVDASCSFFDLFVAKTPLLVNLGNDPQGYGTYFGGGAYTQLAENASTVNGTISTWSCYCYGSGTAACRVYRAGYNGYDWGMVSQGATQNVVSGLNTFTENIANVQVGDRVAAYPGGWIAFGYSGGGGMLIYLGDANPGANGWYNWGYGPMALQATISAPAGGVTSTGAVAIAGEMNIATGSQLTVNGSGHYTASGLWTNNGTFVPGTGTVTFDGESQIGGTATHTFNNVEVTGTLYAPTAMTVNGNWTCTGGTFDNANGTVTIKGGSITAGGQPFYNLTIDNASDGNVALADNMTVAHSLTLTNGTFQVGTHTLTLGTSGAAATAVVNGPAVFSVVGTGSTARGTVTAAAAGRPYAFTVNNGAGLAAKYANFTWMGANGIDVRGTATIDPTNNLSWTAFTAGNAPGTMVKVGNGQTINDIVHADFIGTAGYNIDYTGGTGHLLVTDGTGARWGEDFDNDPSNRVDWATTIRHDVGVTAILSPAGTVGEHMIVFPRVTVRNFGEVAETFDVRVVITDATDAEVFNHVEQVTGLPIGATQNFSFTVNSWDPTPKAPFHVRAQSELAGDFDPSNDMVQQDFVVGAAFTPGWHAKQPVIGSLVKDGGAMAFNAETGLIYEMKGNKTLEFSSYNPADSAWAILPAIPAGTKPVKAGGAMATGDGKVFITKGNNTLEFYRFDISANAWLPATKTVPVGGGKKVKAGTAMAFVSLPEDGGEFVYLLKGYGTEFYKYDVEHDSFVALADAPAGMKAKYDKGSWMVYDGSQFLYVCKSKYGVNGSEFYKYDVLAEAWSTATLTTIPLVDGMGKKKKVGDGSCAAFGGDALYALKANNNNSFWKFAPSTGTWTEKETIPQVTITGEKKKKVKSGAALVYVPDMGVFYAQKGNKSNQFWQYGPSSLVMAGATPTRDGVAAGSVTNVTLSMAVSPNPLATGYATLRYSLPKSGAVMLNVFDVTGRSVMTRTINTGRTGSATLDLHNLSAGVYLVKLSSDGFSTSQKLVVE